MVNSLQEDAVNNDSHETTQSFGSPLLQQITPQQTRRVEAIDVLRGVTALGILIMNVQLFAMIGSGFSNPYGCAWTDTPNVVTWVAIQVFYGYKDLLIFGMLFGVGISLMDERGVALGRDVTKLHYRRMAVLLMFGLAHAYLVWSGDILYDYALCGCVVYLLRRKSIALQLIVGVLAYAVPLVLLFVADSILQGLDPKYTVELYSTNFSPTAAQIAAHNAAYSAGWIQQMAPRAAEALAVQVVLFSLGLFWVCGGSMLVGMGLYRSGMFTLRYTTRSYTIMMALALLLGLPLIIYGLQRNFAVNWQPQYSLLRGRFYFLAAAPFMALGYISMIMLICRAGLVKWLTSRLAAVGQMALTNYIMQSLICSLLFYGHGFGLVGKVDRIGQMGIVLVVWVLQLVVSPIWLRRYRFGPMEWLWRSLSYGKKQPMRRVAISESSVSSTAAPVERYSTLHEGEHDAAQVFKRDPLNAHVQQPSRRRGTVWKLASLTGMIVPGLVAATILQLIARKLAGPLVGRVTFYLVALAVMLVATRMCLKWFHRKPLAAVGIGFDRPWIAHLLAGVVAGSLLMTACWSGMIVLADTHSALPTKAPKLSGLRMALGSVFTLGLCFYQELLCRGYVLQVFGRRKIKLAIAISGLLFVAMHLPYPGGMTPVAILNIVLLHLLMTAVYLRTRSLWLPIGIHAGWNFTLGYVFGLPVSGAVYKGAILTTTWQPNLLAGNEFGPEGGLLVTFAWLIATVAAWLLIRQRNPLPDLLATNHASGTEA